MLNYFTSQNHEMYFMIKKNSVYSLCASVTNEASLPPPPHHQREHSPEYWLSLFRTPIPSTPHTWNWLHTHLLIITPSPHKHTTHVHPHEVLICYGDHFWAFIIVDCLFCYDLDCFSFLWFSAACPDSYLFTGLWFSAACPDLRLYC